MFSPLHRVFVVVVVFSRVFYIVLNGSVRNSMVFRRKERRKEGYYCDQLLLLLFGACVVIGVFFFFRWRNLLTPTVCWQKADYQL